MAIPSEGFLQETGYVVAVVTPELLLVQHYADPEQAPKPQQRLLTIAEFAQQRPYIYDDREAWIADWKADIEALRNLR